MQTFQSLIKYCNSNDIYKLNAWNSSERADLCAKVFRTFPSIFKEFHDATYVTQINGVPEGSKCAVTGDQLSGGVQLKFNNRHICLHSTYYNVWYHYFRIRHFPFYILHLKTDKDCAEEKWNKSSSVLKKYILDTI